jgi:dipeptidyl aminopeptidase/acylaminoacyl peptidase
VSNWLSYLGTADIRSVFERYVGEPHADPETAWRLSPVRAIPNAVTPTLFLHGEADERVPIGQGYEMYASLKARGVETRMVVYPREPHGIGERAHQLDLLNRVINWFDSHLGRASDSIVLRKEPTDA